MWYLTVNEEEPTPGEDMDETDSTAEILYAHQLKGEADALQQLSSRKIKRYFGTVPPRTSLDQDKVASYADSIAKSLNSLPALDGFLVYDIQEEEGRVEGQRPFAYSPTYEPRMFAKLLLDRTKKEPILYRTVSYHPRGEEFISWLRETRDVYQVHSMVLVGGSSSRISYPGYSVMEAATVIKNFDVHMNLGGIVLPERHRDKGAEHLILKRKQQAGLSFFTSQVVYNADLAIWLLRDYDEACKEEGIQPARLIFTFAPFGRQDTANFLKWLGVEIPEGTEKRVLSRKSVKDCVKEAVDICRENFCRILNAMKYYHLSVPIGFAVESVSKYQDESEGSLRLFHILHAEALAFEEPAIA